MVYWDGQRYVSSKPVLIPDIRKHVTNWRRFRRLTGAWPILSIATYLLRFVIITAGVVAALKNKVCDCSPRELEWLAKNRRNAQ
jgi:hypothetical protein